MPLAKVRAVLRPVSHVVLSAKRRNAKTNTWQNTVLVSPCFLRMSGAFVILKPMKNQHVPLFFFPQSLISLMSFLMKRLCSFLHSAAKPLYLSVRTWKHHVQTCCVNKREVNRASFSIVCRCSWCGKEPYKKFAAHQIPRKVRLPCTS